MTIQDYNKRKNELYGAQEAILNSASEGKRLLTTIENEQLDKFTNEIKDLDRQIATMNSIAAGRAELLRPTSQIVVPQASGANKRSVERTFSNEYFDAFYGGFRKGKAGFVNAALGEGGTTDGGNLVPVIGPNGDIKELAPQEASLRKLAFVTPTTNDLKLAAQLTKTTAAAKAESRSSNHAFTQSNATFSQVTLGAYMSGGFSQITLELAQDVAAVSPFVARDLSRAVNNFEEDVFVNGSGSGEPEGILTGADAGQTASLTPEHSLDMLGLLNPFYYNNAQWLMHRQTGIAFQKKQLTDNQFNKYWERVGNVDYFHGFKVNYSAAMPVYSASPAVNGAIAFGDFNQAMVIGDRGGPALQVITDNITQLENGIIRVYGYRRTDSRVLLPEAVQIWTVNG